MMSGLGQWIGYSLNRYMSHGDNDVDNLAFDAEDATTSIHA
jgi:hypothetical protein